MSPSDFAIGQEVFFRYSDARRHNHTEDLHPYFVVTNGGRKWVGVARRPGDPQTWRFNADTLGMDGEGFGDAGRVFLSREAFAQESELASAWSALQRSVGGYGPRPSHLTLADVEKIQFILRVPA